MSKGMRKTGEFCWINILTPRPAEAREFFAALLGWTYRDIPGLGHSIRVGTSDIGGLFDLAGASTPKGTRPHIGLMVKVDSADATGARVSELGGKALPAFDVMDQGRMAVCTDPNGAEFDVWEPKRSHGTDVDASQHGAPSWFETLTTDVERAAAFYSRLFGWTAEAMAMPGSAYTTFRLGSEYVAGMASITSEMGNLRPQWATYFTVADADEAAHVATSLGATVTAPPQDVPGIGRFCGITSPQGVTLDVITYAH